MPEVVNTSFLGETSLPEEESQNSAETMIKVDDVSMVFNMASETMNNLKEYAIALARHELHFKEFRALDHVSLEVKKGDVFGILGTNGSGKSTLLKIIAGVLEPSEGTCTVNGSIAPLIELGAGFDMELTARENIFLNGALLGYSKKFIEEHFDEIVEFAEIEQFLDMPLKNYSSGMVARIAFAIATVIIPEILIVDEVLSVGDFMFQQKCERRINTLIKEHNVTVLIVSHSNDQIERLCNKAIWIEKGHERISGNAHDVCQVYRMLGGHIGSPESEKKIFELIKQPTPKDTDSVKTITGENRFSTAVKLAQYVHANGQKSTDKVILLTEDDLCVAMLGNSLASSVEAVLLTSRPDSIPDITANLLKEYSPKEIITLSISEISAELIQSLRDILPDTGIHELKADTYSDLSTLVFEYAQSANWNKTAIITHPGGSYDLFSLIAYIYENKIPIFYCNDNLELSEKLRGLVSHAGFTKAIILGDDTVLSVKDTQALASNNISINRLYGQNYYNANILINSWIEENKNKHFRNAIFISVWQPTDALTIAAYASKTDACILLLDPQDLDCMTSAFDYLKRENCLKQLTFIGGSNCFNESDKEILLKATAF